MARMGEGRGVHRVLVGKPKGKRPLGRPRRRWEDNAGGRQHRRYIIPQTVTHSLVLLKMGKIISRNMLS